MVSLAKPIALDLPGAEQRRAPRYALHLASPGPVAATIENLSTSGMAVSGVVPLAIGDTFAVELPVAGTVTARVIWRDEEKLGCEFTRPLSRAAVSAARLQATLAIDQGRTARRSHRLLSDPRAMMTAGVAAGFAVVAAMFMAAALTAPALH